MPENWPRGDSGYRLTGMQRHRDPVRGFPPTPGARDPEYPVSHAQGWNGARGGGHSVPEQDRHAAGPDILTAIRRGRDPASESRHPDPDPPTRTSPSDPSPY